MAVPYTFGSATSSIPLSQLDSNFATAITIGSTATYLGNTTTTLAGLTSVGTNTLTSAASTNLTIQSAGTTAVTIDTSQNVGIGTTSPAAKLDVSSSSAGVTAGDLVVDTANKTVYVGRQSSTGGDNSYLIVRGRLNGSGTNQAIAITGDTSAYGTGLFRPNNDNLGFSTLATERMRIDSSGSVAIGSTSTASATRLTLKGAGTGSNTLFNCQDSGGTALLTLAENGNLSFNSGYGSNATAYGCRAWVIFNGTAATVTKSGGVTSITRASAGNYAINFSFTMPDATYSALTGDYAYGCGWNDSLTTTSFSTKRMGSTYGVLADNAQTYAAVFR